MADIEALIGVTANSLGKLLPAFQIVRGMADTYNRIRFARKRCKAVIKRAAFVIKEVHQSLSKTQTSTPLDLTEFEVKLQDVQVIMERLANMSFFRALLRFDEITLEIDEANQRLTDCLHLFQIELLVHHVQTDREKATKLDREDLQHVLTTVAGNYPEIRRQFDLRSEEDEDHAMAAMEKKLRSINTTSQETVEMRLIQKSLECIKATTGRSAPKQNKWLITKYDLEDLGTIGGGGFSIVSKAQFRGVAVAVKTLKDFGHMKEALESEVEIWSRLRHDHIVPFYGASTLTRPPYIVSRYMPNGNLVQYLARNPGVDRTKMVFEVSLGMFYLHEEQVVHGDIKGVNVLVDDSGKACITDFGLSKVQSSGMAEAENGKISGTLRFLAPEALRGQPLTFESDMYAFGMLIYEVFVGEVPFIREPDDRVRQGALELRRPTESKVHERGFNNAIWLLLSECIAREPSVRPSFQVVQARLRSMNKTEYHSQRLNSVANGQHVTDWAGSTLIPSPSPTLGNSSTAPLLKNSKSTSEERPSSSRLSITQDIKSVMPICVEVTLKYFGAKFGISSREPGAHLEEDNTLQWQPIRPAKRSLLRAEQDQFTCQSSVGEGKKSWSLDGNDVTLQSSSADRAVCHFNDPQTARKWFALELSFAKDGTLSNWSKSGVTGDWFHIVHSWRRVKHGKVQKASLVEGATTLVPSDSAWADVNLPKNWTIDNSLGTTSNRIICITNSGTSQVGKFICKVEGRKIVLETYRRQNDGRPVKAREELYPTEEDAGTMFQAMTAVLTKVKEKHGRFSFFSF